MSKLAPSSAARRVACPGSFALEKQYRRPEDSPAAQEGRLAYEIATAFLKNGLWKVGITQDIDPLIDMPNIDPEMRDGAAHYRDAVLEEVVSLGNMVKEVYVDKGLDITDIHPDCYGVPDCWLYTDDEIHLWEYKYGHTPVEVFENWQMIEYMAGIFQELKINGLKDQYIKVYFHIVQPRSFHRHGRIRSWRVKGSDLRPYFNILKNSEMAAKEETAKCIVSSECSTCSARHACEALQRSALSVVDMVTENEPLTYDSVQIGNELRIMMRAAEVLNARITGLSEQANYLIRAGQPVPFFRLEATQGREHWKPPVAEIVALGDIMGVDLRKPQEAITPKQAVKKGMPEDVVSAYSERLSGALKLVPDDGRAIKKAIQEAGV